MVAEATNTAGSSYGGANQTGKNLWAGRWNTSICLTEKQKKRQKEVKNKRKTHEKGVTPLRVWSFS